LKIDLFQIPGVSHSTALCLLCNMGNDIKRFASAKRFASWLRLVPNNKLSGGANNQQQNAERQKCYSIGITPSREQYRKSKRASSNPILQTDCLSKRPKRRHHCHSKKAGGHYLEYGN
jgi:hypothetical protein